MLSRSSCSTVLALCLILPGCNPLQNQSFSVQRQASNEMLLLQLEDARSIEAIDRTLNELIEDDAAQQNVEELLAGWGQHGSWYDLAVAKYIMEHWPSAYGNQNVDAKPLIPIIQERIRNQPELNRHLFWYTQWLRGPDDFNFPRFCRDMTYGYAFDVVIGGEEFFPMMIVTGALNESRSVLFAEWEDLGMSLRFAQLDFVSHRPFLRYDDKLGHYVIDKEAEYDGRYLPADVQRMTERPTPLPNWDHPEVPPRPQREADIDET